MGDGKTRSGESCVRVCSLCYKSRQDRYLPSLCADFPEGYAQVVGITFNSQQAGVYVDVVVDLQADAQGFERRWIRDHLMM